MNHLETTSKYLPKMIESVGCDCEVLINDNGSTDGIQDWLKQYPNVIYQKSNIGCPAGLNLLINKSKGDYIAKIDPDFIMPDNWGAEAIKLLQYEDIGLVGYYWARGLIHPDLQKGIPEKLGENIIFVPKKVFGVWIFSRSLLLKTGLFYDKVMYGNWDSEFNQRVKRHGFRNIYHRLDSLHMGQDTLTERSEKNKDRINEIPDLLTYKLNEFRGAIHTTD